MISIEQILQLHRASLRDYGGGDGIRDVGGLEPAIARPHATFGGEDLYPTAFEKAAAIGESITLNHPFVDANKRTGFLAMYAILDIGGYSLRVQKEELFHFVVAIASGQKTFEEIVAWLKQNTVQKA
jgi:death-on-curing protein